MKPYQIVERYDNSHGVNPNANDLIRSSEYASGLLNAQYRDDGDLEKRKGYQAHAPHTGGYGLFSYERVDPDTEVVSSMVLTLDKNLHKMVSASLLISYTGVDPNALLTIFYDIATEEYRIQLVEAGILVMDFATGLGFDEAAPITLNDLLAAINAIPNFLAVLTGDGTVPAAFLKIVRDWDLVEDNFTAEAQSWTQINSPLTDPLTAYYNTRNDDDFENASAVQQSNCLYVATGVDELYKYDGQTFYRAGLPEPDSITSTLVGGGAITGSNYIHQASYVQFDAAGNIFEGNIKKVDAFSPLSPVAQNMDVTVANIQAGTGFNTDCAIVAGAQALVNQITVDDGSGGNHTMKEGDTAYFFDAVTGDYITRKVDSVTATTITVAGAAVTVADNAVISNNLRIAIYRNYSSGVTTPTVFYLVAEIPNNSFAATQVYRDSKTDANLGALWVRPLSDRSPPPKGKYVTAFQNSLVISGHPVFRRRVYWSDPDGTEYFPSDTNQDDVQTTTGDKVVGIGPGGTVLAILTERATHALSGTLGDNNYIIEQKSTDTGCLSHASIIPSEGVVAWWSPRGPYAMVNGQIPQPIGVDRASGKGRMETVLSFDGQPAAERFRTKRIQAVAWTNERMAIWFVPCESQSAGGDMLPNEHSRLFVYDYSNDAWLIWDNMNCASGLVTSGDEMYFQERRYSEFELDTQSLLYRMHNLNDAWDYEDNNQPIRWQYDTAWEAFGRPGVAKKYVKLRIYSLSNTPNNAFELEVTQESDYKRDVPLAQFTLAIEGLGWNEDQYGIDPYGGQNQGQGKHDLKRALIKSTRMRYANSNDQENVLITAWEFEGSLPYKPDFKSG